MDTRRMENAFGLAAGEERIVYCMCGQETKKIKYTLVPLLTGKHDISFRVKPCLNKYRFQ